MSSIQILIISQLMLTILNWFDLLSFGIIALPFLSLQFDGSEIHILPVFTWGEQFN